MWKKADTREMKLAPLTSCGWQLNKVESLCIEWDSRENIQAVNDRISTLLKDASVQLDVQQDDASAENKGKSVQWDVTAQIACEIDCESIIIIIMS